MVDHGAQVFALDRDPDAIAEGHALVAAKGGALTLIEGRFSEMEHLLKECGVTRVSGVTLDIGVSSMQLERADRGFSLQDDAQIDIRILGRAACEAIVCPYVSISGGALSKKKKHK